MTTYVRKDMKFKSALHRIDRVFKDGLPFPSLSTSRDFGFKLLRQRDVAVRACFAKESKELERECLGRVGCAQSFG